MKSGYEVSSDFTPLASCHLAKGRQEVEYLMVFWCVYNMNMKKKYKFK